ncbi:FAD-dependent oxidoreductase [Sinorhizobium meliloti]|nr:FAD-dependent oxidoreductase [Sinorhizobium meliloti]
MAMVPGEVRRNGTLVVASARDLGELRRFACRTTGYEWLEEAAIATLEPSLAGGSGTGCSFAAKPSRSPASVVSAAHQADGSGGHLGKSPHESFDSVVDCTGAARIGEAEDLRGVRSEILYLRSCDVDLSRPVRLLHRRFPVYIVPRGDGLFMVGATVIETEFDGPIVARSLMERERPASALLLEAQVFRAVCI